MGTPIPTITFNLDISATASSGNNTFSISGTDRTTYSLHNESSFNGFVEQLYYEVGDNIDINFNSNGQDISFIIFDPNNIDISFIFDSNNSNYTISFGTYDNYKFGDSSLNAYGVFNSYILNPDTRNDLNTYITSKYKADDPRNRLQQFNRDDRRFIGNYDYIKSDATKIGGDSSDVNNDLIIQSVVNDIHIVTGEKQRTSIWGNLQVHGNINYTGKILKQVVEGTNYHEEDLFINNLPIGQYLYNKYDGSFTSIVQNLNNHDTSLTLLGGRVSNHDTSFNALQELVNNIDASYVSDTSFNALQELVNIIDASYVSDTSFNALQELVNNIDASYVSDTSFNAIESRITIIDDSLNLLNFDTSYVSYSYFETSYNSLIIEISNKTIDPADLNIIPDQLSNSGKFLSTDGSNLSWVNISGDSITIEGVQGPAGPPGPSGEQGLQGIPGSSDICLNDYSDVSFGNVDISGSLLISGNVKLTNGNFEVSNNLIFNTISVGDKISFKETNDTTAYNILNDNLKANNDASFNNVDISGILKGNQGTQIHLGSHIIPTSNEAFDLGNAEYKIRHLFLSDNSLWIGDEHKIDISNGELKFKKRKKNFIPQKIKDLSSNLTTIEDIRSLSNKFDTISDLSSMKLNDWLLVNKEFKKLDSNVPDYNIEDIFNDSSDNWVQQLNQYEKIVELENKYDSLKTKLNTLLPEGDKIPQ